MEWVTTDTFSGECVFAVVAYLGHSATPTLYKKSLAVRLLGGMIEVEFFLSGL
jgi:hypothetical protein